MLIQLDQALLDRLTDTEKRVIAFINLNADRISVMSIGDVAEQTYSSPATVSRTIKKCGLSGFAELRYQLARQEQNHQASVAVNEIMSKSLKEVTYTIEQVSTEDVQQAIKEICRAKHIYLLARGISEMVAREFTLKLQLMGFFVFSNYDPLMMQSVTKHLHKGDLVIIFSLSGKTPELVHAAENAASLGGRIICITCGERDTPLAHLAHLTFFGFKHSHVSIKSTDATSRLPLMVISRIIVDYLAIEREKEEQKRMEKEKAHGRYQDFF